MSRIDIYKAVNNRVESNSFKVISKCCKTQFVTATKLEMRRHNMLDRIRIEG